VVRVDDQELINVGRSIAQDLDALLGDGAAEVRPRLEELLARAQVGEPVRAELLALLTEGDELRRETRKFLEGDRKYREFAPPPGDPGVDAPPRYLCPQCDYEWLRFDAGEAVPRCPRHDVPLVLC
jgi:hypothetical protein